MQNPIIIGLLLLETVVWETFYDPFQGSYVFTHLFECVQDYPKTTGWIPMN